MREGRREGGREEGERREEGGRDEVCLTEEQEVVLSQYASDLTPELQPSITTSEISHMYIT